MSDYTPQHERSHILSRLTHLVVRVQLDAESSTLAINDEKLDLHSLVPSQAGQAPKVQVVKASVSPPPPAGCCEAPPRRKFRPADLVPSALPTGVSRLARQAGRSETPELGRPREVCRPRDAAGNCFGEQHPPAGCASCPRMVANHALQICFRLSSRSRRMLPNRPPSPFPTRTLCRTLPSRCGLTRYVRKSAIE